MKKKSCQIVLFSSKTAISNQFVFLTALLTIPLNKLPWWYQAQLCEIILEGSFLFSWNIMLKYYELALVGGLENSPKHAYVISEWSLTYLHHWIWQGVWICWARFPVKFEGWLQHYKSNLYVSYMVNSRHTGQHTYKKSTSKG